MIVYKVYHLYYKNGKKVKQRMLLSKYQQQSGKALFESICFDAGFKEPYIYRYIKKGKRVTYILDKQDNNHFLRVEKMKKLAKNK